MIPKEKIEEVRDRVSIVQVISEYVPLTKRGQNHTGLCPFHSEKTPSFTVSEEKKIYYCFGCNATGNAITFVMKKEGLEFPEAVRSLARRWGIDIPESIKSGPDPREAVFHALKAASEFFYKELRAGSGAAARSYFKGRGFNEEIANRFNVGFAPGKWDGLTAYLKKKGVPVEAALDAGLIVKGDKGLYDRFRNRIIFPITDIKGRVIGFGGRALDNSMPKYLNSPESAVFKKGETFYGFFQAKQPIMKEGFAIIVEGYFDLLALHKHGFTNTIATMGTALTPQHLRVLKPFCGSVYSLFDSDQAGKNAAIRGLGLFLAEEMACRAVLLPQGKDPDEFLALSGPEGMKKAIESAEPLMEFFLKELEKKVKLSSPEGKKKYFDTAAEYLLKVKNVAERGHYASIVAAALGMAPDAVYEALKTPLGEGAGPVKTGVLEAKGSNLKELTILRVILKHPELFSDKIKTAIEAFSDPVFRKIGLFLADNCEKGLKNDPPALLAELKDEDAGAIAALLFKEDDGFVEDPGKMLEDSLKRVLNRGRIKETTQEMIRQLEETGRDEVASLMKKRFEAGPAGKGKV